MCGASNYLCNEKLENNHRVPGFVDLKEIEPARLLYSGLSAEQESELEKEYFTYYQD